MILVGDVRLRLAELADSSVNCVVTSPPYWGLRDYGTATWEGGNPECSHMRGQRASSKTKLNGGRGQLEYEKTETVPFIGDCGKCGARRIDAQLGLERTPEEYVARMVEVFGEVRRVLRPDGTLWLNLGDSYAARIRQTKPETAGQLTRRNKGVIIDYTRPLPTGLKEKDLVGIPWRVAFALQADGWYLRQDIIWHKPNPMPESVTDRCTKSHEYIFLLTKSATYYYDHTAIKEPSACLGQTNIRFGGTKYGDNDDPKHRTKSGNTYTDDGTRNKRSVWTITSKPFKGAHFATFPPKLIEPCILAGCPEAGTVLDPFFGAGTTGLVAQRLNRRWIGCELNPEYAELARRRIEAQRDMFSLQTLGVGR